MALQDLQSQSAADWLQAQTRFQNGLNLGLSEQDSAALYLAPIQAKWKIINSAPDEFSDGDKLGKINSDFEDAQISAVKALTGGSIPISIDATEGKWKALPRSPNTIQQLADLRLQRLLNPKAKPSVSQRAELQAAKSDYIDKLKNGTDEEKVAARDLLDRLSQSMELGSGTETATDSAGDQPSAASILTQSGGFPPWLLPSLGVKIGQAAVFGAGQVNPTSEPTAPLEKNVGKFFISAEKGKPDLTNYEGGRAGADAAWALAHPSGTIQSSGTDADEDWSNPNHAPKESEFQKGDRVKQGGIIYKYDGEKFNPVS
jgi:hypothetical protein